MNKNPLLKKIIVAINGSESSVQAAMYAIMLAKQYSLALKAVYVADTDTVKFLTSSKLLVTEEKESYENDLKRDGKTYLEYVKNLAKSKGIEIETELRQGSVWAEIIKAADEVSADMILLGGHESKDRLKVIESRTRRSVAATARSEIVNYAHCPVLVIHKPQIEALFKIF